MVTTSDYCNWYGICISDSQKTGGQMGRAVGAAAYLCKKHSATPRGIYESHITELQDIVNGRGEYEGALTREAQGVTAP